MTPKKTDQFKLKPSPTNPNVNILYKIVGKTNGLTVLVPVDQCSKLKS